MSDALGIVLIGAVPRYGGACVGVAAMLVWVLHFVGALSAGLAPHRSRFEPG